MALYDNGTDYEFFIQSKFANVDRSKFDLSRLNSFTFDIGELRVVDWFETLPNEDHEINVEWLLESLPLAVRPMNRFKIMIDYYYIEKRKLWRGWKTYITKGRDGNVEIPLPMINLNCGHRVASGSSDLYLDDTCESLSQDLGIPSYSINDVHYKNSRLSNAPTGWVSTGRNKVKKACALPFFAYQSIFKYYELNQNLVQNNPHWFPKFGDDYWILPEHYGRICSDENLLDEGSTCDFGVFFADDIIDSGTISTNFFCSPVPTATPYITTDSVNMPDVVSLTQIRYAQFRPDGFTTSLPWLMRGSAPTVNITSSDISLSLNSIEALRPDENLTFPLSVDTDANSKVVLQASGSGSASQVLSALKGRANLNASLDASSLRSMLAMTAWQERNGYTNGSYNKMIESHFRENPNAETYAPIHIGGVASDIYFSDVVQNTPTADSPAGTQVSNAQSMSKGYIGHIHSSDYGIVMGILKVIPDTMYVDGLPHEFTKEYMTDEYFPEFANLSPEPVKNVEIYVSGVDETNNGLFGYQDRYWYLKTRANRVGGLFSLPSTSDTLFSAYSQARQFTSLPKLSNQFVTASPENVRRDMFAYQNEPMFKFQIASRVSSVRPLPYKSIPNTFGF